MLRMALAYALVQNSQMRGAMPRISSDETVGGRAPYFPFTSPLKGVYLSAAGF